MAMTPEEMAELKSVVSQATEAIEGRLFESLTKAIEEIKGKAAAADELQSKAKIALEAVPNLIQEQIEAQLKGNLKGIVEEVGNQFEEKMKEKLGGGTGSNGGAVSLDKLLANSDKIIGVVNAIRSPTTEQAMMGQLNFGMKIHSLMSKLEKGGGSGDEFAKTIADTFTAD